MATRAPSELIRKGDGGAGFIEAYGYVNLAEAELINIHAVSRYKVKLNNTENEGTLKKLCSRCGKVRPLGLLVLGSAQVRPQMATIAEAGSRTHQIL